MLEGAAERDNGHLPEPPECAHSPAAELAARLGEVVPPGLSRVLYSGSRWAATDAALAMAFAYWQRRGGQHRRRTAWVTPRDGGAREAPGTRALADAGALGGAGTSAQVRCHGVEPGDAAELERVLDLREEEVAAVVVEPLVQCSAGLRVDPPGYLRRVRELCDRHDALLICDEGVTGFGRTGTMFACEQERVAPDFLCLGGGLTGGYLPLGATFTTERVYDALRDAREPGSSAPHDHALAGNPLACAAALANLAAFRDGSILLRLQPKIRLLGELLAPIAAMPEVAEVRGRGFIVGVDLGEHEPDRALGARGALGRRVALEARERGAIVRALGDVVVLAPPLTIGKADLSRLVEAVGDSIRAACAGMQEGRRGGSAEPRRAPAGAVPAARAA